MTDEAPKRGRKPGPAEKVEQIDMLKPFWIVFSQTEYRRNTEFFDSRDEAYARAKHLTTTTKRQVAVTGPQSAVYEPPSEPQVKEVELTF